MECQRKPGKSKADKPELGTTFSFLPPVFLRNVEFFSQQYGLRYRSRGLLTKVYVSSSRKGGLHRMFPYFRYVTTPKVDEKLICSRTKIFQGRNVLPRLNTTFKITLVSVSMYSALLFKKKTRSQKIPKISKIC